MVVKNCVICCAVAIVSIAVGLPVTVSAQVNVNVNIGPPPAYVLPAPPQVVVIPNTYVYYAPGLPQDILFYRGYWYRPYSGGWFRAKSYNGPWGYIVPGKVPSALVGLPPGYRTIPPGYEKIPYGQLKKNWSRWERDGYWASHYKWEGNNHGGPPGKPDGRWNNHGHRKDWTGGPPGKDDFRSGPDGDHRGGGKGKGR